MIRRFNYTKRKKIPRQNIEIKLYCPAGRERTFDANIDLSDLDLPPDAFVFVEPYYKASYMRFVFGKAGKIEVPKKRELTDIDPGTVVFFRVKVTDSADQHGQLLAEADGIIGEDGGTPDKARQSILPVSY